MSQGIVQSVLLESHEWVAILEALTHEIYRADESWKSQRVRQFTRLKSRISAQLSAEIKATDGQVTEK